MGLKEMKETLEARRSKSKEIEQFEQDLENLLDQAENISKDYALDSEDIKSALTALFSVTSIEGLSLTERTISPPPNAFVYVFGNDLGSYKVWYEIFKNPTHATIFYVKIEPSSP